MYLKTIWLEIHIKLASPNKIFCQCKNEQNFDTLIPNTNICPVCTWQPGALPTLSKEVLELSLKLWKALNCHINRRSHFDRKSYFYTDLPMWYQITQEYEPTNINWNVKFFVNNYEDERTVRIENAHMECDTAKMIHNGWAALVDFNRAGTPLLEIVTWPDFNDEEEVIEFLKELQRIARYNKISDADMDKWQMRVDVNISLRKDENSPYWNRTELKWVNSFGMIRRWIAYEYQRQSEILDKWEENKQQTRMWNDAEWVSKFMRYKEDALDYRYFPEPDMPELVLTDEQMGWLDQQKLIIPHQIIKRFKQEYWFNKEYINWLINDQEVLDYFMSLVDLWLDPKITAKWIVWPIAAYMKENFVWINKLKFDKEKFIDFVKIATEWKIMDNQMKVVMDEMLATWKTSKEIIDEKWFSTQGMDDSELENIVQSLINENPAIVEQYKWWKTTTLGFFVWQVMKKTAWKANPKAVWDIVTKLLS